MTKHLSLQRVPLVLDGVHGCMVPVVLVFVNVRSDILLVVVCCYVVEVQPLVN